MRREIVWSAWDGAGAEHLRLEVGDEGAIADGLVVGVAEGGKPFRIRYEVRCDASWKAREVRVSVPGLDPGAPVVDLLTDGEGNWTTRSGESVSGLGGCVDVDISATPFTNTLPIRRLGLAPGESAELQVAYVYVGEMRAWIEEQRYTRLERDSGEALYKYESLDGGFTADLPVDADGLVLDYPSLFRRVLP
jgi:uncharacterized protein